jgi:hypothetical protein
MQLQRGFRLGRIPDLRKQELSISSFSSGRHQTFAPLGPCVERMSRVPSAVVEPVPILRPESGRNSAKPSPLLCALQQTAETGHAGGVGANPLSFHANRNLTCLVTDRSLCIRPHVVIHVAQGAVREALFTLSYKGLTQIVEGCSPSFEGGAFLGSTPANPCELSPAASPVRA